MLPSRRPIRLAHPSLLLVSLLLFLPVISALPLSVLPRSTLRQVPVPVVPSNDTVSPTSPERNINQPAANIISTSTNSTTKPNNVTSTHDDTAANSTGDTSAAPSKTNRTSTAFPPERRLPSEADLKEIFGSELPIEMPDAEKSNLTLAKCEIFHDRVNRRNFPHSPIYKALAALMYFVSLAALLFTVVLLLRVRCHSAPRSTIFRASIVFASLLVLAPSMLLVVRHFLLPLDLHVGLNLKPGNSANDVAKCKKLNPNVKWPENSLDSVAYYGTPPLRGGGFWTLIGVSYAFALGLTIAIVMMLLEDIPWRDDWKTRKPAFHCDCDGNATICPHR